MKGSSADRGLFSHLVAKLVNSIIAEMAVLKRISSVSFVTFLTIALVACTPTAPRWRHQSPSPDRTEAEWLDGAQ
jgi:hypothetical protein